MTKTLFLAFVLSLCTGAAFAQMLTCHSRAADKHLAGAAMTSFMNKCERDSGTVCESQAADKKLHGAAKTSFMQKCIRDAVGG
jgi:hypothetical protein